MDLKFGFIIEGEASRDAVHVAVAPFVAKEKLFPGQDAGIIGLEAGVCPNPIGIVDPYLKGPVFPGQRFWLFLYPNTVTGMRHHWQHPAFDTIPLPASLQALQSNVAKSEEWMREFADDVGLSYDSCMDAIRGCDEYGNVHVFSHETPDAVYEKRDDMWKHYEIITGKTASDKEATPLSCSC